MQPTPSGFSINRIQIKPNTWRSRSKIKPTFCVSTATTFSFDLLARAGHHFAKAQWQPEITSNQKSEKPALSKANSIRFGPDPNYSIKNIALHSLANKYPLTVLVHLNCDSRLLSKSNYCLLFCLGYFNLQNNYKFFGLNDFLSGFGK